MTRVILLTGVVALFAALISYQFVSDAPERASTTPAIPKLTMPDMPDRSTFQSADPFRFGQPKATPEDIASVRFEDADGRPMRLDAFRGKYVLLNVWATWCEPCREEMPTLDRLQAQLGSDRFQVVALSVDLAGQKPVREFYDDLGLKRLDIFVDASGKATFQLGVPGIPGTLLLDDNGRELARYLGQAEWDSPQVIAAIRGHLDQ